MRLGLAAVVFGSLGAVVVWAEVAHWQASRRRLGASTGKGNSEAIIVLGYRNPGVRANYINRYRVRAGIRSQVRNARDTVLVLCGGGVAGAIPEAELMARYARQRGYVGDMRLDRDSRTTWENIQNVIPLVEDADRIKIVSNSLHAEKGRAYLWKLRPDLASRLVRAEDYRFGELTLIKPFAALIGLRALRGVPRWI